MLRRHLLMLVCLGLASALATVCAVTMLNVIRLAQAQTFVQDFVQRAVNNGSAMPLPDVAPAATAILSHDTMIGILDRARRIGPLIGVGQTSCAVAADARNICGGQIMACIVTGTGREGAFEAAIAMCRGGNLAAYALAASRWTFDFADGVPAEERDRSHI